MRLANAVLLQPQPKHWECPKRCGAAHVTHEPRPHTPFHSCREMYGLSVAFVPEGTRCEVKAVEREDYIGKEMVQFDGRGQPVMSTVTIRDDGQDCTVYAPCATAQATTE